MTSLKIECYDYFENTIPKIECEAFDFRYFLLDRKICSGKQNPGEEARFRQGV